MTSEQAGQIGSLVIALAVAWWGYKRGSKSDAVAGQLGMASETRAGTQQIMDGLNALIDQLQEGAATHKDTVAYLQARLDHVIDENIALKVENLALRRQYGINGD